MAMADTNDFSRSVHLFLDDSILSKEAQYAIGRLSVWAGSKYPIVRIFNDGKTDFVATYHDVNGRLLYTIGAVLRDNGEYSFHS